MVATIDKNSVINWLVTWIAKEVDLSSDKINSDEPFVNFGLGSRQAISMAADLEDWLKRELPPSIAWEYPTIEKLAEFISSGKEIDGDE